MQDPTNLNVFKEAYQLALDIYKIKFPKEEIYGLQQQIRRAAISIPLNISEGSSRRTDADFLRFLHMSAGSCKEVSTLLQFSKDLNIIDIQTFNTFKIKIDIVGAMLTNLIKKISSDITNFKERCATSYELQATSP